MHNALVRTYVFGSFNLEPGPRERRRVSVGTYLRTSPRDPGIYYLNTLGERTRTVLLEAAFNVCKHVHSIGLRRFRDWNRLQRV